MKLVKVVIQNFLSFREATVLLKDRGLVAIEGKTKDKDGANSNGSGKSSLINAILWCNYGDAGKSLDGVDDVVNAKVNKDCHVSCFWYDDVNNVDTVVSRYRKHHKYHNGLYVTTGATDISKGTNPETQLLVNEILGADKATFEASCFAKQEDAPDIPGMTDGELKGLLEKVLPFDSLHSHHKKSTINLSSQLKVVEDLKRDLSTKSLRLEQTRDDLAQIIADIDEWESKQEQRGDRLHLDIERYREEIAVTTNGLKPQDKLDAAIKRYQELVDSYDDQPRQRYDANGAILEKAVIDAQLAVKKLSDKCLACQRPFDNYEQALEVATWTLTNARAELSIHNVSATIYLDAMNANNANREKLDRLVMVNRTQERQLNNIERAKDAIKALQTQLRESPVNPYVDTRKRLQDRFTELETECFNIGKQIENEEAKLPVLEAVVETFSPKGVRYHILEEVTPVLNQDTNKYLSQLTDGAMSAEWSTVTKLKNGTYREKFSIKVKADHGKGYGNLSGGEKRKVRLACFFALQDLIASRATKRIDLWCGDEIDDALDEAGMERLMSLLHEKSKSKSTILVISHNQLNDWIPNTASVVKENKVSTITGYLSD